MCIRTNKMKAVSVLLKRVRIARSTFHQRGRDDSLDGKLEELTRELNDVKEVFMKVKKNEDELLDTLTEVDGHLRQLDKKRLDAEMDGICKRIRDSAHKLLPMDAFQHSSHPSSTQHNNPFLLPQHVNLTLDMLEDPLKRCLLSLSIFHEHAVLKKRHTIYWWIGVGYVSDKRVIAKKEREGKGTSMFMKMEERTAEEEGEEVIDELLKLNQIVSYGNAKSPLFNKFQIHPHFRPHLQSYLSKSRQNAQHLGSYIQLPYYHDCLVLEQHKVMLRDWFPLKPTHKVYSVFNVGASYLNFGSQWWDEKRKHLWVLQLGRWQDSPLHHIEVGSQEFLKDLRHQTFLRYLSLRGISRISELPPFIAQIPNLKILDLKACHNLETLPNDISSMESLTHLILSHCYLLDAMPKGIDKLTQLQVLKGFVLGSSTETPCTVSDLANLKKLRRLSIHIGSEAVIKDGEFERLGELPALEHLKISWGVSRYNNIQVILPPSLKKLHLEGFPGQKIPEWLKPSKLPTGFKELKITGGKLESINHEEDMNQWGMEIVLRKYLKHLKLDLTNLQMLFPLLRYVEIKQILNHSYYEWSID